MKKFQLRKIIREEIQKITDESLYSDDSKIAPGFIKQTTNNKPVGQIKFKINQVPLSISPKQNQDLQSKIFHKHFGKIDPNYLKYFFTNRDKWSTIPSPKDYDFEYDIKFLDTGDVEIKKTKSTSTNQPKLDNPDTIILPFNIYYIENNRPLRDIGLDGGVKTEPELMWALWDDYQKMQKFERTTKSGGDKYTNMMQDMGINMDFDVKANEMFYGGTIRDVLNNTELYVSKGSMGKKEKESKYKDPYTNFVYEIYYDKEGTDFRYSKQEADKYQYMLIDNSDFKEFVDEILDMI